MLLYCHLLSSTLYTLVLSASLRVAQCACAIEVAEGILTVSLLYAVSTFLCSIYVLTASALFLPCSIFCHCLLTDHLHAGNSSPDPEIWIWWRAPGKVFVQGITTTALTVKQSACSGLLADCAPVLLLFALCRSLTR